MKKEEIELLKDVIQIAKLKLWGSEIGDDGAQEIINEIHTGKYGSTEGIWVQVEKIKDLFPEDE